ncbi:MAG: NAD(P)-dependent oxidoreductase [Alphaproteobacteria bacterium]|nr:NAD(P)-dependent oxidoreductase [Alphaproteobacteria bacterium]
MATVVFGGAGFVGLNIVETLLAAGEPVTLFDAGSLPERAVRDFAALPGTLSVIQGDVTEPDAVSQVLGSDVDCLVYGAAITAGTARDREDPERTLAVNLMGFMTALRAAKEAGVGRVINLSSAAAYGPASLVPETIVEDVIAPDPVSLYSITKFASERVGARMADLWGLDVVSVRLSAVFGKWERLTGVRDTPSPLYQIAMAALKGEPALLPRADTRDWLYASDVARAVRLLRDAPALSHPLYHISTGTVWSALDWGQALAARRPGFDCRLAEPGEKPTIDPFTPKERGALSIDRLVRDTGYAPAYGLARSVEDYDAWLSAG